MTGDTLEKFAVGLLAASMIWLGAGCRGTQVESARQTVLSGYDAMMVSDYHTLLNMMTEDVELHGVDGSMVNRTKLTVLARKADEWHRGTLKDESLAAFLVKREAWAKKAKATTVFQSVEIDGDTATVTTLDSGTPGKIETSVYTLRRIGPVWKLRQEVSTQKASEKE